MITYVNLLEIDLLPEHGILWFFPEFHTEGDIGRLHNIAPEASDHNLVSAFLLIQLNGDGEIQIN